MIVCKWNTHIKSYHQILLKLLLITPFILLIKYSIINRIFIFIPFFFEVFNTIRCNHNSVNKNSIVISEAINNYSFDSSSEKRNDAYNI